jgi:hypothetical protein
MFQIGELKLLDLDDVALIMNIDKLVHESKQQMMAILQELQIFNEEPPIQIRRCANQSLLTIILFFVSLTYFT